MTETHFRKLENMYLATKIKLELYPSTQIEISEAASEISIEVDDRYFHALDAMHGSVYFRMLDDAAFFAVNSLIEDVFVLTTSFNITLTRPVSSGKITSKGLVRFRSKYLYTAEATLYNEEGKEVAFGTGNFALSKVALTKEIGYKL
jgi:uncharacterized protein (TIGR00369 family)